MTDAKEIECIAEACGCGCGCGWNGMGELEGDQVIRAGAVALPR